MANRKSEHKYSRSVDAENTMQCSLSDAAGAYRGAKLGYILGSKFNPNGGSVGIKTGAVLIGTGASYECNKALNAMNECSQQSTSPSIPLGSDPFARAYNDSKHCCIPSEFSLGWAMGLDSCSIEIGIYHNVILQNIDSYMTGEKSWNRTNDRFDATEAYIVNSMEFKEAFRDIVKQPLCLIDQENPYLADEAVNLILENIGRNCDDMYELIDIVRNYTTIINTTQELPEEQKEWLYGALAVIGYSYAYWNDINWLHIHL